MVVKCWPPSENVPAYGKIYEIEAHQYPIMSDYVLLKVDSGSMNNEKNLTQFP